MKVIQQLGFHFLWTKLVLTEMVNRCYYKNDHYGHCIVGRRFAMVYENFNKLKLEKKTQIISVAVQEFVKNGFDKGSTNEIVKRAGISKGSLFHYFKSKKDLYVYLINYGIQVIEGFYQEIDLSETDLFKRIEKVGLQKLQIHQTSPYAFDFLASAVQEESVEVKDVIEQKVGPIYQQGLERIYANIDYSKFREDIDIEKAIEILNWTMYGFGEKGIQQIDTFENSNQFGELYHQQWKTYADMLKRSFYK